MVYVQLMPHKTLQGARNCYRRGIVCTPIATDGRAKWKKLVNEFFQHSLTVLVTQLGTIKFSIWKIFWFKAISGQAF